MDSLSSRVIVALSGGKASAWCADWAIREYGHDRVVLYFNDTKWEHADLYRFLEDLQRHLDHPIVQDSDGRNPETLFFDERMLANDRAPFCSRVLKAERLHRFCEDGETIVFGIGTNEAHRANRIIKVYAEVAEKRKIALQLRFPLISERIDSRKVDRWLASTGIREPELYRLGFKHNNCSGGCVRMGKGDWLRLLRVLPHVYAERERVEEEFRQRSGKRVSFMKDESLRGLRIRQDRQLVLPFELADEYEGECIGVCSMVA